MIIEHVAMYVNDLEKTKVFFIKYFDAKSNDIYVNKNTGFKSYFLSFSSGARLEIMNRIDMQDDEKGLYRTGFVHIAFSLGSKEKVDELTNILKDDGYNVISGPRTTGDGYYESLFLDLEGNQIEITI
ncbi:VOC family protein [Streptobacillus felis]|uniref:VOC family protein n=1 Tax=Streptobacillus felis TaxID=1384509 RepID=A0A7Z0PI64_9FUSO|nr:VOC family protein [Streptobacillus felis]NYV28435.1 VOC family protein [Streptobacillus felis]